MPRRAPPEQTLLDIKVTIATCNHDLFGWQCQSRFIESVNVSGSLLGEKRSVFITAGPLTSPTKSFTAQTGDGQWHQHQLGHDVSLAAGNFGQVELKAVGYKSDERHKGFKLRL